jgi:hypothetical protein
MRPGISQLFSDTEGQGNKERLNEYNFLRAFASYENKSQPLQILQDVF